MNRETEAGYVSSDHEFQARVTGVDTHGVPRDDRMLYFSTGSIVTFSGPDTLSATMRESIQPNGMSPLA